jgi:major membrane immunogen (membrane-anchored lipoprotein)
LDNALYAFKIIPQKVKTISNHKMKKTIISMFIVTTLISGILFTSCGPSTPKEETFKAKVEEAKEYQNDTQKSDIDEEWKAFKDTSELQIRGNVIRIAELKVKIKKSGKEFNTFYENKIDALEQQNKDMKDRIDVYERNNQSDWESFKREFNHDIEELGNALKDLTVDNKK